MAGLPGRGAGWRLLVTELIRLVSSGGICQSVRSPVVLAWCARSQVDLLALDVGLDTATSHGKLAARCLVAAGDGARHRPRHSNGARSEPRQAVAR